MINQLIFTDGNDSKGEILNACTILKLSYPSVNEFEGIHEHDDNYISIASINYAGEVDEINDCICIKKESFEKIIEWYNNVVKNKTE